MELMPIGFLQRTTLRKVATDCGFDLLQDLAWGIEAASTQAPLKAWIGHEPGGAALVGLSMFNVLDELQVERVAAPAAAPPQAAGWIRCAGDAELDRTLLRAWSLSRTLPNALQQRFEHDVREIGSTEREATVRQRVGQSLFREGLMVLWGGRCAISGLDVPELLRASHAKPWADSTDAERLDVYNGLLLAAHLDAAFDSGLIAVAPSGEVLVSTALPAHARLQLGLVAPAVAAISVQHQPYLQWHRERVFRPRGAAG